MVKQFSKLEFEKWENAYLANMTLPFITKSALIELSELETFLIEAKKLSADSARITFLRFEINKNEPQGKKTWPDGRIMDGCEWMEAGHGLTQVAVALVPTESLRYNEELIGEADNIIDKISDQILMLIPGGETEGPTGHNPPPSAKEEASDTHD